MYEYKVITARDGALTGRFSPADLEALINTHAHDGWRVVAGLLASSLWKSTKSEILCILERPLAPRSER